MVERLSNLIGIFQKPELDFSGNRADNDDSLGDAYEYLMRHFATESGNSKIHFYSPSEVSRVIAQVIGIARANDPWQRFADWRTAATRFCAWPPAKTRPASCKWPRRGSWWRSPKTCCANLMCSSF